MRILVTGATGKVGQTFLRKLFSSEGIPDAHVRALCHRREVDTHDRLEIVRGSITDREVVREAMVDVTHVLHLATCKETPEQIMDVTVKGLFWLLEECRESSSFERFVLIGGDAGMGHFFYPHPVPVTEDQGHSAYPGCYALSKVLEEVMLEQYYVQYDLDGCCLRAPWIMEKDDFKHTLSFGNDVFGGPRWNELVDPQAVQNYTDTKTIPKMCDRDGSPIKRNFVHVDDLVDAILIALQHDKARQQLFHICMDEPVDYGEVAAHLARTRKLPSIDVPTDYASTWLDNAKARFLLDWRPQYDLARLIDSAFDYQRDPDDPRTVSYPG
jgi:UDP-glucose 4-epimerase